MKKIKPAFTNGNEAINITTTSLDGQKSNPPTNKNRLESFSFENGFTS